MKIIDGLKNLGNATGRGLTSIPAKGWAGLGAATSLGLGVASTTLAAKIYNKDDSTHISSSIKEDSNQNDEMARTLKEIKENAERAREEDKKELMSLYESVSASILEFTKTSSTEFREALINDFNNSKATKDINESKELWKTLISSLGESQIMWKEWIEVANKNNKLLECISKGIQNKENKENLEQSDEVANLSLSDIKDLLNSYIQKDINIRHFISGIEIHRDSKAQILEGNKVPALTGIEGERSPKLPGIIGERSQKFPGIEGSKSPILTGEEGERSPKLTGEEGQKPGGTLDYKSLKGQEGACRIIADNQKACITFSS